MKQSKVSKTAAYLAIKFYGLTRISRFRSLFDQPVLQFYNSLVQFLPPPLNWYHPVLKNKTARSFFIRIEELLLPGDLLHVIARKWYFQQIIADLLDQGYDQILILGAGFDHTGYYFSQRNISCFELDTSDTARLKHRFLHETYSDRPRPHIISARLKSRSLADLLHSHPKIDPEKKTIVVAEGFFAYLTYHNVSSTFITLNDYFSHKIAIVTTHFSLNELPRRHRWVYKKSVRLVGEKLRFQTPFDRLHELVTSRGFNISQVFDRQTISKEIKNRTGTYLPLLKGFYILLLK